MRLTFQVRFHTNPGQNLWLLGDHELFGGGALEKALPMRYVDAETWEAVVLIPHGCAPDLQITYNYILQNPDGTTVRDDGRDKQINLAQLETQSLNDYDEMQDGSRVRSPHRGNADV